MTVSGAAWVGATMIACLFSKMVFDHYRARWCNGRVITRPLARALHLPRAPLRFVTHMAGVVMYFVGIFDSSSDAMFVRGCATYVVLVGVPALDDYVTGDDDRWKRFGDWVRNKIKWRMSLPAPSRLNPGAA